MRVLLLHPKLRRYIQPKLPPLGILSVASFLEKIGHKVRVVDLNVYPEEFNDNLLEKIDIVGVTATTPLIKEAWHLLNIIKKKNLPVIFGGPHSSALPEESLKKGVDLVVRGEGEQTMAEILAKWPKKGAILGVSYLKDGKAIHAPPRPLIKDIDTLPFPAFHLLENLEEYTTPQPVITEPMRTLTMVTSRGCPYGCNYCYKGVFGKTWRAHSPEYVVNLWEYIYKKFNVKMVGVQDDTFNLDYQRVEKICQLLKTRNIKTYWTTAQGMRADRIDKALLSKMKEVGFIRTGFGIESGSPEMIKIIGKQLNLDRVKEAIDACKELGIESIGYFMIGNYGENKETMEKTIKMACKFDPDVAHFTIAVPLPGAPLFEIVKREGKFLIDDWDLYGYTRGSCFFEISDLKKELVEKMWRRAYRRFYLRPKILLRFFQKKSTWLNLPKFFRASLAYLGIMKN
ncbi:MAG: hypothetical protein COT24_02380 [Candidatus Kerfeldbacteria bacterium CG08_land_8_20_14_0_20_40_16]|uniref:Uncharacterized protein n=1 Tax=Candidatus Kerfeldbacteria bacterium CG08_land_8_20_14_0_20_40_16 TaxID=2014244 RepID=A0A2H0YY01_9BACT|nr:MAG: hypothetical protein COT24_02380 [Candidatus Kerfeldbacteria bacterium CG08_land_8_20_14_0_20_40_16]